MLNSIALFYPDGILNYERLGLLMHQVPSTVGLSFDNSEDLKNMSADYKKSNQTAKIL